MEQVTGFACRSTWGKPLRVIAGSLLALYLPVFTILLLTGTPRFLFFPWFYFTVAPLALSALAFSLIFRAAAIIRMATLSALVLALWLAESFLTTVYYFTQPQTAMPLLEAIGKAGSHMNYATFVVVPLTLSCLALVLYWNTRPDATKRHLG